MIVGMWMTRNLVTIQPGTPVPVAAALMSQNRIRRLPVVETVEDDIRLVGLVSATDIYHAFPPDKNPFAASSVSAFEAAMTTEQIMTRDVLTTTQETPIEDVAAVMRDKKIGALPVMRGKVLVGLITESDIFRAFIGMLNGEPGGTRVTFSTSEREEPFEWLAAETRTLDIHIQSVFLSRNGEQNVCVARMTGPEVDKAIEDLWRSGHQVLNVLRWPEAEPED